MSITDKINYVNDKYKILKQIGSGTFGDIYLGMDKITEELVSIKFEDGIKY
jgi:serine/threonine protein kinase